MKNKYTIYIDENFPRQLATGLHTLVQPQNVKDKIEIDIISIVDEFGFGAKDEEWIPEVGKKNGIVITQDFRIQQLKHQKELYIKSGIGILFFSPPSKSGFSYWDMVKQLVNRWDDIKQIVKKNKAPFAYKCSAKTKFEKLD
jgi:hypothetical protein